MQKYTYTEWLELLEKFNSKSYRSNIQKNKRAIDEGLMDGSINTWMDMNKDLWKLSKYKQLTERFDSNWFRPAAIFHEKNKYYTKAPFKTAKYKAYWDEEYRRCTQGYEINGFRCPGDLYYWLNYYNLPVREKEGSVVTEEIKHPKFIEYHYAWSHYLEWSWHKEDDAVCVKPRGCGMSEYAASCATNTYTVQKGSKVMFCASFEGYLLGGDGVMNKASTQLDWLNSNTQRGMKKLRHVSDTAAVKTAGTKDKEGTASGWLSTIMAKVIDKPSKLRGSRCRYVFLEEAGSFKGLGKVISAARGLIKTGGIKMGTMVVWGTGGDEGSNGENLAGLMEAFYQPEAAGMLGLHSPFTDSGEPEFQGFFFPAYAFSFKYIDKHGVVDCAKVLEEEVRERKKQEDAGNVKGLTDHAAEYPFWPREAFSKSGTNDFDKIKLEGVKRNIRTVKGIPEDRVGDLFWIKNEKGVITGVKFEEMAGGKVHIIEEPEKAPGGKVPANLYIGGVDGIDYGVANSLVGEKGSKFAIAIKKKYLSSEKTNNIYVAYYMDRPNDEREAYERALKLAVYYNARLNVERTRKEVISYFRRRKMLRYIAKEVSINTNNVNPAKAKKMARIEGTSIKVKTIQHYIGLIKDYIIDYGENIFFLEMVENLINFSYELKGKFDLVVAMGMCELLDEDDAALNVNVQKEVRKSKEIKYLGYFINEEGYREFGVITEKSKDARSAHEKLNLSYSNPMDAPGFEESVEKTPFNWVVEEKEKLLEFDL